MKNLIKTARLLLILTILAGVTSCKTKEKIIYKTENRIDSTEVVNLKRKLSVKENQLISLSEELKSTKNQLFSSIEKLQISESEKQNLKENFKQIIEEYDEKGNLIKKTTTEKISELAGEINRYKEQNKELTDNLKSTAEQVVNRKSELKKTTEENTDLKSVVKVKNDEIKKLKSEKTGGLFSLKSAMYGAGVLLVLELVLFLLVRLKVVRIPFFG